MGMCPVSRASRDKCPEHISIFPLISSQDTYCGAQLTPCAQTVPCLCPAEIASITEGGVSAYVVGKLTPGLRVCKIIIS